MEIIKKKRINKTVTIISLVVILVEAFGFASTFILELQVVYKCTYNQCCWHSMDKMLDLWEAWVHCASIKHRFHHVTNGHWWCYGCTCATWISPTCTVHTLCMLHMNIFNTFLKSDMKTMGFITDHPIITTPPPKKETNHSIIWGVYSECIKFLTVKSKAQYKWPFL